MPKPSAQKPPAPAPKCPACQRELSPAEASAANCPHCGTPLPAEGRPGEPDAGKATVSGIGQTIQGDDLEFVVPSEPGTAEPPRGGKSTIDESQHRSTIDERSLPPAPPKAPPGGQTIDQRAIGQTLDEDAFRALSQSQPPTAEDKSRRTVDERQLSQTFDSADFTPRAGSGTVPDRAIDRTLDSAEFSREEEARLNQLWADAVQPGARPGMTIKGGESGTSRAEANLKIQPRTLRQAGDCKTREADYELLDTLGEGGMGVVYMARQASIDRTVALKMIKASSAADVVQREKFLSEAVVTGELDHPNIVPIYDLGCNEQGALFYAMKRVEGTPWDEVITKKSLAENIEILMKVADAVGFAHSRGVIHRDLKPQNVMLGGYGEVLVMDWGLALPTEAFSKAGTISPSAGMGGTPAYMAPEMASGRGEQITTRSDVYLLGAILFEIVTGTPPHTGKSTMTCLFSAAKNEIVQTDKSGELIELALRAMATRPADRYATVADFQTAIRDYLSHSESIALSARADGDLRQARASDDYRDFSRAVFAFEEALALWEGNAKARRGLSAARAAYAESASRKGDYDLGLSLIPADEPEQGPLRTGMLAAKRERDARQQRLKAMKRLMMAGVGVFMAVVSVAAVWINSERTEAVKQKGIAEVKKIEAEDNFKLAESKRKEAEDARAQEEIAKKDALAKKKEAEDAREKEVIAKKEALAKKKEAEDARAQEEIAKKDALAKKKEAEDAREKEVIAKKEALAKKKEAEDARAQEEIAKKDALAKKKEAEDAREKEEKAKIAAVESEKKAVAAREAAVAARKLAEEAKVKEEQAKVAAQESEKKAVAARKTAEEAKIKEEQAKIAAQESEKKAIAAREAEEYEAYVALIGLAAAKIDENAFGTARQLLASCKPQLRNWEWGRLMHVCSQESRSYDAGERVDAVAFAPDGKRFATGNWHGLAQVWDVATGKAVNLPHPGLYVHAVAFSSDGRFVATGASDRVIRVWDVESQKIVKTIQGHTDSVMSVAFSRDGRRLLSGSLDQFARLWDIASGKELQKFVGHTWWVWDAAFSPDETQIVTASQDGTCRVWSTDGKSGAPFTGHRGPVYSAAFAPDGQTVASGGYDKRVLVWRPDDVQPYDYRKIAEGKPVPPPKYTPLDGHLAAVRCVEFSSDGQLLISGGHDNAVNLWHVKSGRLIKTLRGHDSWVRSCTFSRDQRFVLSAGYDRENQIKLWDVSGYEEVRVLRGHVLRGHTDSILSAAFSLQGDRLVTASRDRTAKTFDFRTGKELATFAEGHAFLAAKVAFFDGGKRLATSAVDNTVRVWDVAGGTQSFKLPGTGQNAALAVAWDTPQGHPGWLITGSDGAVAKVWSTTTGELLQRLTGHRTPITALAVSRDNRYVFTADEAGRGKLWDTNSWREVSSLDAPTRRKITAAAFLPDGSRLLTASLDKTVTQWDLRTGREVPSLLLRHPDGVVALAVTSDGRRAVTSGVDGAARVWDLERATVVGTLTPATGKTQVDAVDISPDGVTAVTVNTQRGHVQLWDLQTLAEKRLPNEEDLASPFLDCDVVGGTIWSAAFSPDGRSLVTIGGSTARLWDAQSPRQPRRDRMSFSPQGAVAAAEFSPDGVWIVTGSWDNSARIWDAKTGKPVRKLTGKHTGFVNTAVFSPDGAFVLTASDDHTAILWNAKTGEAVHTFKGHTDRVRSAVFSADGALVLTASSDKTARIWSVKTGQVVQTFAGHQLGVLCAAFSPDGARVITGSEDNTAKLWDAKTGKEIVAITGHTAAITSVAFSPDEHGSRVLTASEDYTAKLWDATEKHEGKAILNLKGHTQEVTSVRFSHDGRYVCTGSRDGTAMVWLTTPWQEPQAAVGAVPKNAVK